MSRRARRVADEDDESYFISLSDLMAGVLFLFIIMLTYFGLELRKSADGIAGHRAPVATVRTKPVVVAPPQPAAPPVDLRTALLERLDASLQAVNSPVQVDIAAGELRVPNAVVFGGGDALSPSGVQALSGLAGALIQVLPCAAASTAPPPSDCPKVGGRLLAVSIEGHASGGGDTLTRSAVQAAAVYRQLIAAQPALQSLRADPAGGGPPVVSVAAFASSAAQGDSVEIKMATSGP